MKVHYINIVLFALPLNILVTLCLAHNKNKLSITHDTPNAKFTKSHRSLYECDLYTFIYNNDPEMKALMANYDR
ncbi:hypothetical protein PFDG_00590 [Plasmodium falciparum Dd2]|uniref:Uncharacterized protein n=1 Tax=Plasmodium falciparum (isolate Dd2) TaxID=57267 RepID=A0A0L7LXF2_PLAF4|nr:hypothetical protein PFDG_00590 [Plasmodium falciparum Dd2]